MKYTGIQLSKCVVYGSVRIDQIRATCDKYNTFSIESGFSVNFKITWKFCSEKDIILRVIVSFYKYTVLLSVMSRFHGSLHERILME